VAADQALARAAAFPTADGARPQDARHRGTPHLISIDHLSSSNSSVPAVARAAALPAADGARPQDARHRGALHVMVTVSVMSRP